MTGKDLLDAIGYVDESLLERCQRTEQIERKKKISWCRCSKKYLSLAACAGLVIISVLGITAWQYNFSGVGDTLVHKGPEGIIVSSNVHHPEEEERLPKADDKAGADNVPAADCSNGAASDSAEDTLKETDQEPTAGRFGLSNGDYQSDLPILPDTDTSSGTNSGVDNTPKGSEDTDILPPTADKLSKADETGDVSPKYSQGITIETVKEIPQGNPSSEPNVQPGEPNQPDEIPSVKKILTENTVIIRGTVKKIQHFHAMGGQIDVYFSVVSLKVKDAYRADGKGSPQKGKICKIYLPAAKDAVHPDSSILGKFTKGSEAIVMPYIADAKTGIHKKGKFFAFLDVSDYYFESETAESHVFLKTKTNVLYDTRIYEIPHSGKKVTLDDIENYLKKNLKKQVK